MVISKALVTIPSKTSLNLLLITYILLLHVSDDACSEDGISGDITDTKVGRALHVIASLVPHDVEACLALFVVGLLVQDLQRSHHSTNGMSTADGVLRELQVVQERVVAAALNRLHGRLIHALYRLINGQPVGRSVPLAQVLQLRDVRRGRVGRVAKVPRAPVAEVGAHDEGVLRVLDVRGQRAAHGLLLGPAVAADEQGHDLRELVGRAAKRLPAAEVEVGQMHLKRVLTHVGRRGYVVHAGGFLDALERVAVDDQISQRRGILTE